MSLLGSRIKEYYYLAKPGIIYGNLLTTIAAFLFASRWHFAPTLFLGMIVGISLVIASGCVLNNILDRDIDAKMERTKGRAMVTGTISRTAAYIYALVGGAAGAALLAIFANPVTTAIALFGLFMYAVIYTPLKRSTQWAAIIGSIPGAVPIVVGYTAVAGRLDSSALTLFLILALWQLPHFYAIAIRRQDEYDAAGIPVLPSQSGLTKAKHHIIATIILYLIAACSLTFIGHTGYMYFGIVLAIGLEWLRRAGKGVFMKDDTDTQSWARNVFLFSLIVLLSFSVTLAIAPLLA